MKDLEDEIVELLDYNGELNSDELCEMLGEHPRIITCPNVRAKREKIRRTIAKSDRITRFGSTSNSYYKLTSDFEVLGVAGTPKRDQVSPKKFPRSFRENPTWLLGGVLGAFCGPRSTQKSPQATFLDTVIQEALPEAPKSRSIDLVNILEPPRRR